MAEIADHRARSIHRLRGESDQRPHLKLIAGALDSATPGRGVRLVAPAVVPPMLSPSNDICGVSRGGWVAAAILYVALATVLALAAWQATPPEPWPASPLVFKVVFEEPPAPPAPAPPAAPEPPSATAETPPEPAAAEPEPTPPPPPIAIEPTPQPLPKPPPAKPVPPRHHPAAPSRNTAPALSEPTSSPPAEPQVATLTPPAAPILPPQPISGLATNRKPDYPLTARQGGQQGRVVLRVEVSAAGAPTSVTVVFSSGYTLLDKAALAAVAQWRFHPATQGGMPVSGVRDLPIEFRLEE
jgi:protein TonB